MAPPPSSRRRRNRVAETPDSPASSSSTPATTKKATSTTKVAAAAPLEVDIAATTTNTHANSSSSHWRNWCLPSLVPHWQAHARQQQQQWINDTVDSNSHTNTARRVAAIHTSFQEAVLARSLSRAATLQVITTTNNTGKDGEENKDEDETNQQWVWKRCLCHFIDCALAASELKNSSNSTSSAGVVAALLELTVQVAAAATGTQSSSSSVGMLHAVTEHLMPFAMHCPVESVRRAATGALGAVAVAACAAASSSSSWTIRMEDDSDDSDSDGSTPTTSIVALLDALQQALLSRLTDTAVSVRCAALHAVFGPTHFSTTTSSSSSSRIPPPPPMATDPDLRQAGVWILQHDSSAANRAAAARLLPVTVHTVDAMVCRLRDTHAAVRQAASAALFAAAPPGGTDPAEENGVVVWQSHHFTEILSTGLTPRYVFVGMATIASLQEGILQIVLLFYVYTRVLHLL